MKALQTVKLGSLIGNRLQRGFHFNYQVFDYGQMGAISVKKNRRHAFRFSIRRHLNVALRLAIRRAVQDCKRVVSPRYVPTRNPRRNGMVIR